MAGEPCRSKLNWAVRLGHPAVGMSLDAKRLLRFCLVGGLVALVDFGLIWLLVQVMPRLAAVAVAYLLAVTLHFLLNRSWVFSWSETAGADVLKRYAVTVVACWLCTVGVTGLSLAIVTSNVFLAKAMAIPPATLLGFLLMRGFVFPPASGAA